MDFVVVGLGLGAIALLAGVVLSGWSAPRAASAAGAAAANGVGACCLAAGAALILATIGALAGSLDDRTGAFLVATVATVAALGLLLWGTVNHTRIPWLAPRQRSRPDVNAANGVAAESVLLAPALATLSGPALLDPETNDEAAVQDLDEHDAASEPGDAGECGLDAPRTGDDVWDDHLERDDDADADHREEAAIAAGTAHDAAGDGS